MTSPGLLERNKPLRELAIGCTERRRSRTDRAVGYTTAQVLKTCWATGPVPLRGHITCGFGAPRGQHQARVASTRSLGSVFDHVGVAVSDLTASERFYRTVLSALGVEPSHAGAALVEWEDWAMGPTAHEHPLTRGLHVGFPAPSREAVDAFWRARIAAGYRDDGAPGTRTVYGPDYYGGFLLDPDGHNVALANHNSSAA